MASRKHADPNWVRFADKAFKGTLGGLVAAGDECGRLGGELLFPKKSRPSNAGTVHIHYHGVPPRRR